MKQSTIILFSTILAFLFPLLSVNAAVRYTRTPQGLGVNSAVTISVSFDDFEADTQLLSSECPTWSVEVSDEINSYFPSNMVPNSVNTGIFSVNLPVMDYRYVAFSCNAQGGGGFLEGDATFTIFTNRPNSQSAQFVSENNFSTVIPGASPVPAGATISDSYVAPVSTEIRITTSLYRGSRGEQVKLLQGFLQTLKFFPSDVELTGYFGPITERAVMEFQASKGIESIGIVGPKTRKALLDSRR